MIVVMYKNKMIVDEVSCGTIFVHSVDKMPVYKMPVDDTSSDWIIVDLMSVDEKSLEKTTIGQVSLNEMSSRADPIKHFTAIIQGFL